MPEYIEREAFIKRLENEADKSSDIINLLILNGIANIVRDENIAPTADVVEVRHGEWIDSETNEGAVCSLCKSFFDSYYGFFADEQFKYCPNCGAKMDGKGD